MSNKTITDIFFNTTSYYDYSNGYSTTPNETNKKINVFDKYQEHSEIRNRSWIDDNGFI